MKIAVQLNKIKGKILTITEHTDGDRIPLDLGKNSFDRMWLARAKKDGAILMTDSEELLKIYKEI